MHVNTVGFCSSLIHFCVQPLYCIKWSFGLDSYSQYFTLSDCNLVLKKPYPECYCIIPTCVHKWHKQVVNGVSVYMHIFGERAYTYRGNTTYRDNTIENRWCLFIYIYVCMSFCTLTLRIFVFAPRSTPSQTSLNRILRFSDHYPYHLRNWIVYRFEFFCGCS